MRKIEWTSLVMGIVLIVGGIFALANPAATFNTLEIMLGVVAIIEGVAMIVSYLKIRKYTGIKAKIGSVFGLVLVILGLVFLFWPSAVAEIFNYFIAIWFITDAIRNLAVSWPMRNLSKKVYWISLVLNLLVLAGGVALLFNPMLAGQATGVIIGLSLVFSGVWCVIFSVTSKIEA